MEIYVPDIYQKSIYNINYNKLKSNGIKCLLFDLDNTIVPFSTKKPTERVIKLFNDLKDKEFKIILFSNSGKRRLKPFKEMLGVDCFAHVNKPSPKKFLEVIQELGFNISEVAIIGDQIMTDVLGGNRVGITTILVNPISKYEFLFTYVNRIREHYKIKKLSKMDLFYKGKYYE